MAVEGEGDGRLQLKEGVVVVVGVAVEARVADYPEEGEIRAKKMLLLTKVFTVLRRRLLPLSPSPKGGCARP